MDDSPVIVGTDGSQTSLEAVEWAAREAVLHGWPLRIVAVPALPPLMSWYQHPDPPTVTDLVHERAEQALAAAAARAVEIEPGVQVSTALLAGPPARALSQAGESASMLVVGSRAAAGSPLCCSGR